jgi:hypothetical protein
MRGICAIALIVVGVSAWLGYREYRMYLRAKDHALSRMPLFLDQIENAIFSTAVFDQRFPCDLPVLPTNVPAAIMYAGLRPDEDGSYTGRIGGEGKERRTFLDSWLKELHFRIAKTMEKTNISPQIITLKVSIWSEGPNEKDEAGRGDDIVTEFEVELPSNRVR